MAFTDLGSLGANGITTANEASLALTTAAVCAVGELVVVVVGVDNRVSGGGDDLSVASVQNSGSPNVWYKAKQVANNLSAQAGASCSIWYTVVTNQIANGATITATFTTASTSDASAITARHFSMAAGQTAAIEGTPGVLVSDTSADPGALDVTTANIACLRIRGIASQVGNNTNLTPTASWTAWANGNSATSGTTGEICARAEHIISTATGASSNPTYVSAIYASAYVAFKEGLAAPLATTEAADASSMAGTVEWLGTMATTEPADSTGAGPIQLTFTKSIDPTTFHQVLAFAGGSDVVTHSAVPIGPATSDRYVVIIERGDYNGGDPTSVVVGPKGLTKLVPNHATTHDAGFFTIWGGIVNATDVAGTTANVVITFPIGQNYSGLSGGYITGSTATAKSGSEVIEEEVYADLTLPSWTVPEKGVGLIYYAMWGTGGTAGWSGGVAQDYYYDYSSGTIIEETGHATTIGSAITPTLTGIADVSLVKAALSFAAVSDGSFNGTVGASAPTGTLATTEPADVSAMAGLAGLFGPLATTEPADVSAQSGLVGLIGTLATSEPADVSVQAGTVTWLGTMATTEAADVSALVGLVGLTGTLATSEPADAMAFTGNAAGYGPLTTTEAADGATLTGSVSWAGILATTESADAAAMSGTVAWAAALASTEPADAAAFAGAVVDVATGTLAATETYDVSDIQASVPLPTDGTMSAQEAADGAVIAATVTWFGVFAATEAADAAAFAALAAAFGSLAATSTADASSLVGSVAWSGTMAATEAADGAALAGLLGVIGTAAVSEPADHASFVLASEHRAILAADEASDTAAFGGGNIAMGVLDASDPADAAAMYGGIIGAGALDASEAPDEAAFAGEIAIDGVLVAVEAADAFTAAIEMADSMWALEAPDVARFNAGISTEAYSFIASRQPANIIGIKSPPRGVVARRTPPPTWSARA